MSDGTWKRRLGGFLGAAFLLFGLVETGVAIAGQNAIAFFWFPALCGGGALILLGIFVVKAGRASQALVIAGSLSGALATAWTVVAPLLSLTLIALVLKRTTARTTTTQVAQVVE